jgi:hypothetical protein
MNKSNCSKQHTTLPNPDSVSKNFTPSFRHSVLEQIIIDGDTFNVSFGRTYEKNFVLIGEYSKQNGYQKYTVNDKTYIDNEFIEFVQFLYARFLQEEIIDPNEEIPPPINNCINLSELQCALQPPPQAPSAQDHLFPPQAPSAQDHLFPPQAPCTSGPWFPPQAPCASGDWVSYPPPPPAPCAQSDWLPPPRPLAHSAFGHLFPPPPQQDSSAFGHLFPPPPPPLAHSAQDHLFPPPPPLAHSAFGHLFPPPPQQAPCAQVAQPHEYMKRINVNIENVQHCVDQDGMRKWSVSTSHSTRGQITLSGGWFDNTNRGTEFFYTFDSDKSKCTKMFKYEPYGECKNFIDELNRQLNGSE